MNPSKIWGISCTITGLAIASLLSILLSNVSAYKDDLEQHEDIAYHGVVGEELVRLTSAIRELNRRFDAMQEGRIGQGSGK